MGPPLPGGVEQPDEERREAGPEGPARHCTPCRKNGTILSPARTCIKRPGRSLRPPDLSFPRGPDERAQLAAFDRVRHLLRKRPRMELSDARPAEVAHSCLGQVRGVPGRLTHVKGPDRRALEDEIRSLRVASRKIEAIQVARERLGLGLAEAKDFVESVEAGRSPEARPAPVAGTADLLHLLRAGRKIEAIKLHKERSGIGLKEAKEAVDALEAKHGVVSPARGCLALLLPFLLR